MDQDLTTPLLKLNPPVLVRTSTGGDLSAIELSALRRTAAEAAPVTPVLASLHKSANGGTAPVSLSARKLQDAKRTAQDVNRQTRGLNASATPTASHAPQSPARNVYGNDKSKGLFASGSTGKATVAYSAAAASLGNSVHRLAADLQHPLDSAPQTPNAHTTPSRGIAPTTTNRGATQTAAAAFADGRKISANIQYLMRHIHDTGTLLDTLFPIQKQSTDAAPSCSVSPSFENRNWDGAEEDTEQLISVQTVSAAAASREDVMVLHGRLRDLLDARRARSIGLCPIRRELYRDLFSEMLRQITIEEPARGLLLARVREEADHDLQIHAALLQEGERFASAKLLEEARDSDALKQRIALLEQEKAALQAQQHQLLEACNEVQHRFEEERQLRNKQQHDELQYLRRSNQQLSLRFKLETERESGGGEVEDLADPANAAV